jgi:L-rhamnose mutarotase
MEYLNKTSHPVFKRFCKTLELKNDPMLIDEYKQVHAKNKVWSEITRGMKDIGIIDMEIYLSGTHLFMIMDTLPDFNHQQAMAELAKKPRQAEWETLVSRFQKSSGTASADEKWSLMERIYKLDK